MIAEKDNEIYAIEVKTGEAYLLASQVKVSEIAEKQGLKPYILHMKM